MKNIANYISITRIVTSIGLIATNTFSISFNILYIYCGISDILDGYIARKTKSESRIGSILDSISDLIFFIVAFIKIIPLINLPNEIIYWIIIIFLNRIYNIIISYIYNKKIILMHTIANKITGLLLFISPLIFQRSNHILFEIIICMIATFSALQEWYYIRKIKR